MIFPKNKVFIIAEIGNNHEGNFNLAKKMINSAAKTGADAVKFQTFIPEKYVNTKNKKRLKQLKKFQLSIEQFKRLKDYAKKKNYYFFQLLLTLKVPKNSISFRVYLRFHQEIIIF